jgi:hypothetical protein
MSVRNVAGFLGKGNSQKTVLYFLHIRDHAQPAESGFRWEFLYFLPYFLDGEEFGLCRILQKNFFLFLLMQPLNEECLLQPRPQCMALQCIVWRALECEIRVLGYHVILRVGLDL